MNYLFCFLWPVKQWGSIGHKIQNIVSESDANNIKYKRLCNEMPHVLRQVKDFKVTVGFYSIMWYYDGHCWEVSLRHLLSSRGPLPTQARYIDSPKSVEATTRMHKHVGIWFKHSFIGFAYLYNLQETEELSERLCMWYEIRDTLHGSETALMIYNITWTIVTT